MENGKYNLALECKNVMDAYKAETGKNVEILFLQNHGIFFAADTVEEIDAIASHVMGALAEEVPEIPAERKAQEGTLYLKFPHKDHPSVRHMRLVFNMFPGTTQVKMVMADTRKVYGTQVLLRDALIQEAKETLGEENVVVK